MANSNPQNRRLHPKAFTIIEMIIVMTIMGILGTIGTRTYFAERNRFEFNSALIKTMQLFKTVRTYATTSYPVYVKIGNVSKAIVPVDGYGIMAELKEGTEELTLTLFANVGTDGSQKDDDPNTFNRGYGTDIVLETYTLPKQIAFRYFYFDGVKEWQEKTTTEPAGPTSRIAHLVFRPPLGDMVITGIKKDDFPMGLSDLSLQFTNPASEGSNAKKCQKISISGVKVFPELTYSPEC
jgi:prepilin-type N-terminal cleavage/methylation domain-containing protein